MRCSPRLFILAAGLVTALVSLPARSEIPDPCALEQVGDVVHPAAEDERTELQRAQAMLQFWEDILKQPVPAGSEDKLRAIRDKVARLEERIQELENEAQKTLRVSEEKVALIYPHIIDSESIHRIGLSRLVLTEAASKHVSEHFATHFPELVADLPFNRAALFRLRANRELLDQISANRARNTLFPPEISLSQVVEALETQTDAHWKAAGASDQGGWATFDTQLLFEGKPYGVRFVICQAGRCASQGLTGQIKTLMPICGERIIIVTARSGRAARARLDVGKACQ